jgi:hypothetical protein
MPFDAPPFPSARASSTSRIQHPASEAKERIDRETLGLDSLYFSVCLCPSTILVLTPSDSRGQTDRYGVAGALLDPTTYHSRTYWSSPLQYLNHLRPDPTDLTWRPLTKTTTTAAPQHPPLQIGELEGNCKPRRDRDHVETLRQRIPPLSLGPWRPARSRPVQSSPVQLAQTRKGLRKQREREVEARRLAACRTSEELGNGSGDSLRALLTGDPSNDPIPPFQGGALMTRQIP